MMGDKGIGVAMAHAMLRLEDGNGFHVLHAAHPVQQGRPVIYRLAISLLDGREVRRRPLHFLRQELSRFRRSSGRSDERGLTAPSAFSTAFVQTPDDSGWLQMR